MRVGIDATSLRRKITGLEYYTLNLIRSLLSYDASGEYVVFFRREVHKDLLKFSAKAKYAVCPVDDQIFCEQVWLPIVCSREGLDCMHYPAFPPGLFASGKIVMTVHDAVMWKYPETLSWKNVTYVRPLTSLGLKKAAAVITVSESSKKDLISYAGIPEKAIFNTGESINASFRVIDDKESLASIRKKYSLPQRFILSVGSIEPRKNIISLLRAYRDLKIQDALAGASLVLVGREAWGTGSFRAEVESLGITGEITYTGYVPSDDLVKIYNMADVFVFPSIYEGFGLPPLEAMACGVPVITSNSSSLPEVVGDAALLVDPKNVEELAGSIKRVLGDPALRDDLSRRSCARAARFNWEEVVRKTVEAYGSVCK